MHTPELKAKALEMLLTGNSPRYVAAQLGLSRTTVRRWQIKAFAQLQVRMSAESRAELGAIAESVRGAGFSF